MVGFGKMPVSYWNSLRTSIRLHPDSVEARRTACGPAHGWCCPRGVLGPLHVEQEGRSCGTTWGWPVYKASQVCPRRQRSVGRPPSPWSRNEQEEAAPSLTRRHHLPTAGPAARRSEEPVLRGSAGRTAARPLTVRRSVCPRPGSKPGVASQGRELSAEEGVVSCCSSQPRTCALGVSCWGLMGLRTDPLCGRGAWTGYQAFPCSGHPENSIYGPLSECVNVAASWCLLLPRDLSPRCVPGGCVRSNSLNIPCRGCECPSVPSPGELTL